MGAAGVLFLANRAKARWVVVDCDATAGFGLLARQERRIIPCFQAEPSEDRGPIEKQYLISKFVYF
jgi:hypothetical protein